MEGLNLTAWALIVEGRHVCARGDVDPQQGVFAGGPIIAHQRPPQSVRLDTRNRIGSGIKIRTAAENLGGHCVSIDAPDLPGEGLSYEILQKGKLRWCGFEIRIGQQQFEMAGNFRMRRRSFQNWLLYGSDRPKAGLCTQ